MGDYAKEYEEYLKAERELYISQLEKERAEQELEELKRNYEAEKQAEAMFREQQNIYQRRRETYENVVENEKTRLSGLVPPKPKIEKEEFVAEKKEMILEDVNDILLLRETDSTAFEKQEKLLQNVLKTANKLEEYSSYIENLAMLKESEEQEIKIKAEYDFLSFEELKDMPSDAQEIAKRHIESEVPEIVSILFTELPDILKSLESAQNRKKRLEQEREKEKREVYGKEIGDKEIVTEEDLKREQQDLDKQINELRQKKDTYLWNNETFSNSRTAGMKEFSFTKWEKLDKERQQKVQEEINHQIQQYTWTKEGEKPVQSLEEYFDFEKTSKARIVQLQEEKERLQREKDSYSDPALIETIQKAKKTIKQHEENIVRLQHANDLLPKRFTELKRMDTEESAVLYKQTVERINKVIGSKREQGYLKSLEEYWILESNYIKTQRELEKKQKDFDHLQKQKSSNTNELIEVNKELETLQKQVRALGTTYDKNKAKIKDWIREENKALERRKKQETSVQKQQLKAEETALENAKTEAEIAEKALKQQQETYQKNRETEIDTEIKKLEQKQESQKRFLKDEVIQSAMVRVSNEVKQQIGQLSEQKKKLDRYWNNMSKDPDHVSKRFQDSVKTEENQITKLQGEYEKKKKSVNAALEKAASKVQKDKVKMQEWERDKTFAKKSIENMKSIVANQRNSINSEIRKENEKNKKLNESIEKQAKKILDSLRNYDDDVNAVIEKDGKVQKENAKSDCRRAAFKKKVLGMTAGLMGTVAGKFRDELVKITEAQIKGEVAEKEKQIAELNNRIKSMGKAQLGVVDQGNQTNRQQVTTDELIQQERMNQMGNKIQESQNQLTIQLATLNQEVKEMRARQDQRIQENRERIDAIFQDQPRLDADLVKRRNEIMKQISEQVEKLPDVQIGDQEAQHQLREEDLENLILEDKKMHEDLQKSMKDIEEGSENLKGLMTDTNLSRIDLAVKVIEKICNIVINGVNKANGVSTPKEPIDLEESIRQAENALSQKTEEHVVNKILGVGELVYDKITELNNSVQQASHEAEIDFWVAEQVYTGIAMHNNQLKKENLSGNLLDQSKELYDIKKKAVMDNLKKRGEFGFIAAENISEQKKETERKIQNKQKMINGTDELQGTEQSVETETQEKSLKETVQEKQRILYERKSSMNLAFAETVKAHETDSKASVELNSETLSAQFDPNSFEFLSQLTGVEMNKDMPLHQAMSAFGRIYINGLNAIDYFQLDDRYKNAKIADIQQQGMTQQDAQAGRTESQKLVDGLVYYGDSIRQALEAQMNPEKVEGLHGDAKRLHGQMIAVEGQNMKLCGVKLSSTDLETAKRVEVFNKHSESVAEEFNKVRSMTAEFEIEKQEKAATKQANPQEKKNSTKRKVNLLEEERQANEKKEKSHSTRERLAEAVHKSRGLWR